MISGAVNRLKKIYSNYYNTLDFFEIVKETPSSKNAEALAYLMREGINMQMQDEEGYTPLHWAARRGYREIIQQLILSGANINAQDIHGKTALHHLVSPIRELFRSPGDLFISFPIGEISHDQRILQLLLENGANCELRDENGDTPLHLATKQNFAKIVRPLLAYMTNIDIKDHLGRTPLHWAASRGYMNIVTLLLDKKPDLDIQDNEGNTPLHLAAKHNRYEVVQQLLAKGAKIDIFNNNNESPLVFAYPNCFHTLRTILKIINKANRFDILCEALGIPEQKPSEFYYKLYNDDMLQTIKTAETQYANVVALNASVPSPLLGKLLALCEEAETPSASAASSSETPYSSDDETDSAPSRPWCRFF
ncbi:ankyrin repeat domain-containing protein [Candidatus Berkiella aquae]|uniref:Ankyrin repeat domain-containing protein n=1 Tax=Candidatus Berkiella aquae TaxID=295108 RepID=A0A0Q9YT59_9GAMM|nr:ankyrin repeat domain-containing protein [Candidatus Berkiella aquae]MCS5711375.1 ankyrin repeat domain-containing protein [Candidatus Berkiella aquae]